MRVRLRDVAQRAGVSVKTVSNVVNGYAHVSPEMRAHVQAVLDETGYRPNLSARSLRAGRTGVIALALPQLDNPYFAELTRAVVEAAEERGWTVLIDQTDGLRERELVAAEGVRHHLIDGLIMSPVGLQAQDLARRTAADLPLVLLGERFEAGSAGHVGIDHVAIDNVAAARTATEHLLALGRTRVAAIGDQSQSTGQSGVSRLRMQGWHEALASAGLAVDEAMVRRVPSYERASGAGAMAALLDGQVRPDAVLCFNDTLALGALRTLADRGLRVPEDVAVVGVDDVEDGRFSVPTLSTIAPNKAGIASTAVRMLADRLEPGGAVLEPREVQADFCLVVRESTSSGS